MTDLTIALVTIFGTVASMSGVIAYVFNGTRKLIKEMHATVREMHATVREMHATSEQTQVTLKKMGERAEKMDIRAEQRHEEVVELLKKGFGEVLHQRAI